MNKLDQKGAVAGMVLLVIETVALLGVLVFALTSYSGERKYKNNANQLISQAVATAVQSTQASDNAKYAQASKSPLTTYIGPEASGSLNISYPKTWSGYIDDSGSSGGSLSGYFYPGTVPSTNDISSAFALRFVVEQQAYSSVIQQYNSQATAGTSTVQAYALPKVPSVVGIKVTGSIANQKNGIMIILPLRSNTLEIWTESPIFFDDFNNFILPNFSFSP